MRAAAFEGSETEAITNILRTAFSTLPEVDMAAYTLPMSIGAFPDVETFEQKQLPDPPAEAVGEDVDFDDIPPEYACKLLISARDKYIPPMTVRNALVEDYDDLDADTFHNTAADNNMLKLDVLCVFLRE